MGTPPTSRFAQRSPDALQLAFAEVCVRVSLVAAEPERRARLLGAGDVLNQATGFTHSALERMSVQSVARLREQLEQEGWGAAYREGWSLPFGDVATLTLALLDDFTKTLAPPKAAAEPAPDESPLSKREAEVLRLVAAGLTSKAIGRHRPLPPFLHLQ